MKDFFQSVPMFLIVFGYTFGPFFGIYAAIVNGSVLNGFLSLCVPFYGIIYWLVA